MGQGDNTMSLQFKLATDTSADLPQEYLDENNIGLMSLAYSIDGITYDENNMLDSKEFFDKMRAGSMPITSQVNPEQAKEHFLEYSKECKEILYLAFSSGLSGTFNAVRIAAEEVMEENPDIKIKVIDTKCASLGQGLIVYKAVEERKKGKTFEEVADYVEKNMMDVVHIFTVDDLNHLHRGGRVSKATAVIGTLANIKPILHMDDEGKLVALTKARGRKKSLLTLVDIMEQKMGSKRSENDVFMITHGDCIEDAEFLADAITERFGITQKIISILDPTIGAHTGPGLISLFFMGDER